MGDSDCGGDSDVEESAEDYFTNEFEEAVNENKEGYETDYSSEEEEENVIFVEDRNKTAEKDRKGSDNIDDSEDDDKYITAV